MNKRIIGLGTVDITDLEKKYVNDVLDSGRISPGKVQKKFEEAVANASGYEYGTFVNSGQSALHLSFEALKLINPYFKKVVCPAVTYISTLHAAWNAGLEVELIDVEYQTFNMHKLQHFSFINPTTDIICPVNLMGLSNNIDKRFTSSDSPVFWTVEDNCESIFAPETGYGDLNCTSFYASHMISTGSGGCVMTNDKHLDDIIKSICNHGRTNPSVLYTADRNINYDRTKDFVFDKVAFSFKMSDLNAALGLAQVERRKEIMDGRRNVALKIHDKLSKYSLMLQLPIKENNTFMNFPIVTKELNKNALVSHLNDWNIETRSLMPILNQPVLLRKNPHDYMNHIKYPNAMDLLDKAFYIGCHQHLTDEDIEYIGYVFDMYYNK